MPLRSPELGLLAASLMFAAPLSAQRGHELGIQAIGTASDPALAVAGVYGALRTSTRTRISASAGAGVSSGELGLRGEILGHFLLSPNKLQGTGFYMAGGVAGVSGPVEQGYLVLTLGIESRPGATAGWAAELGVGGGFRLALGYRWRRHYSTVRR
jgi:hypothetical protein